jgi:pimeloyl-ACP methyl ester carboxylesterase
MRPISDTKWIECVAPTGEKLVFVGRPEMRDRHKSVVLLIHDVLSSPENLAGWFAHLEPEAEVLLSVLPGHGNAPHLRPAGLDDLVSALDQCLRTMVPRRRVLVVGAGFGGLVALGLNNRGYACVAVDPMLSTSRLWPLGDALADAQLRGVGLDPDFLFETFGWRDGALAEPRSYGQLLDRLKAPAMVICGDVPLEPRGDAAPSWLDEADHALLAAYPATRVQVIDGCGHDLLAAAPDACRDIILDELARA